jgi:hypothetical protein
LLSEVAHATAYQGTVTNVSVSSNGAVAFVVVSNGGPAGGSCPLNSNSMVFSIPLSPATDAGKALLSLAMSAKVTGLLVYAVGDGNCTGTNIYNGGPSETLLIMDLKG